MDDLNITMEEYIRLEEEKAHRRGQDYNWETGTYVKIWCNEDVHDLRSIEIEFSAIVLNDALTSEVALSCEPTVSPLNDNQIDFRISFDKSDDEDYTVVGYTEEIVHDFELRLEMIFGRQVNRVHILDFEGLTLNMRQDLAERMRMVYTRDNGARALGRIKDEMGLDVAGLHTTDKMAEDGFGAYWLRSERVIPDKGDLSDYWDKISSGKDFLRGAPLYTYIRDLVQRLCHRLLSYSIYGRGQAPEKVTATDLFYFRSMDRGVANVPYLLAHYLFRQAEGRKSGARLNSVSIEVSSASVIVSTGRRFIIYLADGPLSRYKARLVANGSTQLEVIDVDETFSPRSLYGLKQAPRAWFQRFTSYITRVGFQHSRCDSSLFIYRQGTDTAPLLLVFLSQKIYVVEILERAHMVTCNPSRTPIDTESKLGADGDPVSNPTLYRSLAGSLQYLTFTRPDISYAIQQVCLYMHDPREPHFSALKRILRYVQGTLDYGLQLFSSSTTDLVAYSDADWAGCPTTRRSTLGYYVFLCNNLLSWSSKRQPTLSRSSAEAEYRGVANAVAETCWLRNLLRELHTPLSSATLVYCDNVSAVYLSCNPVQHQRTKHIEIDIHFVRDLVVVGQVRVLHVPSRYQFEDISTKGLPSALFEEFRSSLSVRCPPAATAGEC
ncbi:ribonuclease H-like domain-containing protein [Tanacetum coccineum]